MKRLQKILLTLTLLFASLFLSALGYYVAVTKDVSLEPQKLLLPEKNVVLYDYQHKTFKSDSDEFKHNLAYRDLPQHTISAFVFTEDKRFFTHNGFDWKRIVKAAYNNAKSHSFQQGASTISQQLVKNTHLSQEKTLKRKLQEWKLTRTLEKNYTKEEIFEKYVNVIYFGHNVFGLHAAANFYFDKTPQELDIADSAILAGLVKSPNNYSPFKNPKNCQTRKESVLKAMLKNNAITKEEFNTALQKPLPVKATAKDGKYGFSHCVFDELSSLAEENHFILGGKICVYTAFDRILQAETERIFDAYTDSDQTLCVLDKATNCFKAYLSTVDDPLRSPGSLIKPLLVYAPALEKDILSPATPLLDEKINFSGYSPANYDNTFHGYVSARESLAKSLNIPAVKLLNGIGIQTATSFMEKLGLPIDQEDFSLALALGGMKAGFPFTKLLSAYNALENGTFCKSGFIREITIDGRVVYQKPVQTQRVFSKESAYLTTDILCTAAKSGTAKKLRSLPFSIAAKTGTVGTENGNTDAYAISYTTRDVVGCWIGNANRLYVQHTGGGVPCNQLFAINTFLSKQYEKHGQEIEDFKMPRGIKRVELDKFLYYDTHSLRLADQASPSEYRFSEIFKESSLPLKKSDLFTNPHINPPILTYEDGVVRICFDKNCPSFYQYKIERNDYVTHRLLYQGEYLPVFTDENVLSGKQYVYTVTPIYNNHVGTPITLPMLSTKPGESFSAPDKIISNKEWWNY